MPEQQDGIFNPVTTGTGPFSNVLQGQTYQGSPQPTVSGYGGKGEAIAMFADKFLAGVSQGRRTQFERSEQQRERSLSAVRLAIQNLQSAPIPDELKQAQMGKLQQTLVQMIAGDHSLDGGDRKKGSGKKGGGQSSGSQPEHPAQHLYTAVKSIAESMLGPGAQKQPVSHDELMALTGETYHLISDPKNNIDTVRSQVDQSLAQAHQALSAAVEAKGGKVTIEQLNNAPGFMQAAQRVIQLNNGKPTVGLQKIMEEAQLNSDQARLEASPEYRLANEERQSRIERDAAQTKAFNALADKREADAVKEQTQRLRGNDGSMIMQDLKTGKFFDTAKNEIPPDDPRLLNAQNFNQISKPTIIKTKEGVYRYDPVTKQPTRILNMRGAPVDPNSPAGQAIVQGKAIKEVNRIDEKWSAKIADLDKNQNLTEAQKNKMRAEYKSARDREFSRLKYKPEGAAESAAPPKKKGGTPPAATVDKVMEDFDKFMMGGAPPASGGPTAQNSGYGPQ
jgi:hypothetical protein